MREFTICSNKPITSPCKLNYNFNVRSDKTYSFVCEITLIDGTILRSNKYTVNVQRI